MGGILSLVEPTTSHQHQKQRPHKSTTVSKSLSYPIRTLLNCISAALKAQTPKLANDGISYKNYRGSSLAIRRNGMTTMVWYGRAGGGILIPFRIQATERS